MTPHWDLQLPAGVGVGRDKHFLDLLGLRRRQVRPPSTHSEKQLTGSLPHPLSVREGMVLQLSWRAPCTQTLLSPIGWPVTGTLASQARNYCGARARRRGKLPMPRAALQGAETFAPTSS